MNRQLLIGKYTFEGLAGSTLVSYENGVIEGTVRKVGTRLVYAYSIYRHTFKKDQINWCLLDSSSYEEIRKYKSELFNFE